MLNTLNETRLPVHAQVLDWLARQQQAMQDLLQKVVNIESGSRNEAGVTAVAHALAERLQAAGVPVQFEPVPGYGVLLHAQVNSAEGTDTGGAPIILMGHMDTVFPDGTVAKFDDLPRQYWGNVNVDPPFGGKVGDRPALSDSEIDDVVTFLGTLTDGYFDPSAAVVEAKPK